MYTGFPEVKHQYLVTTLLPAHIYTSNDMATKQYSCDQPKASTSQGGKLSHLEDPDGVGFPRLRNLTEVDLGDCQCGGWRHTGARSSWGWARRSILKIRRALPARVYPKWSPRTLVRWAVSRDVKQLIQALASTRLLPRDIVNA